MAQPYTLRLTGMTWPDGLERMLVTPTNPVLFTYYITNHDISGDQTAIGTPLTPALSYFGGQLDIDSFDLSTVPGLQPEPWAWLISQVNFVHTVTLDVAGGSVAAGRLPHGRTVAESGGVGHAVVAGRCRWRRGPRSRSSTSRAGACASCSTACAKPARR